MIGGICESEVHEFEDSGDLHLEIYSFPPTSKRRLFEVGTETEDTLANIATHLDFEVVLHEVEAEAEDDRDEKLKTISLLILFTSGRLR